ncbi:uncharacterized protein PHALS_08277 [Plasmopara halstedii]|uniref:Uncharacterized protein n=1 Tax=Plasmopara halstedii TaxID=4781 RepID=A0A0P1ACP6_PLAHL|nr:uncharacterized protein PHALS_08277 [Plasmopara halstedii]CEG38190.1 hypothetical protein PHALS_08277 [Plasmopara halstedii]|eukprot:XP_024574559.1 hypothetical protein PHALS_08277 [Plasmopara halstedii]
MADVSALGLPLNDGTSAPLIRLEFRYRQVDIVLVLAYGGACFFSFWALAMHAQSPTRQAATLGFYLLMGLASLTRVLWFATPFGVHSVLVEPPRIMMGDNGWAQFLLAEAVELLGSYLLYSVFVLIVVFWADMLRRLFTHESVRSHPLRVFFSLLGAILAIQTMGFAVFAAKKEDSYWLLVYDDVVMCLLSVGSLAAVLVYSFRMKTVLQAFLEVSQIDTTDRIRAVNWATFICTFFLIANSIFLTYSIVSLAHFHQAGVYLKSTWWWLFVALKHLVEIFVLYFLLYTLWGKSSDDAENSKDEYEQIPDGSYLGDDDFNSIHASGSLPNTPKRLR